MKPNILKIKTKLPFENIQKRLLLQPLTFDAHPTEEGWDIIIEQENGLTDVVHHLAQFFNESFIRDIAVEIMKEAHYSEKSIASYLNTDFLKHAHSFGWFKVIQQDLEELITGSVNENKTLNLDAYCLFTSNDIKKDIRNFVHFLDETIIEELVDSIVQPILKKGVETADVQVGPVIQVVATDEGPVFLNGEDQNIASVESFDEALFPTERQEIFEKEADRIVTVQLFSLMVILATFYDIETYLVEEASVPAVTYFMKKYHLDITVEAL